jgi:hypothetical protein
MTPEIAVQTPDHHHEHRESCYGTDVAGSSRATPKKVERLKKVSLQKERIPSMSPLPKVAASSDPIMLFRLASPTILRTAESRWRQRLHARPPLHQRLAAVRSVAESGSESKY